ncbi:hypothetical protein BH10PSE19_BH10PSE19_11250 [soil metagenome]
MFRSSASSASAAPGRERDSAPEMKRSDKVEKIKDCLVKYFQDDNSLLTKEKNWQPEWLRTKLEEKSISGFFDRIFKKPNQVLSTSGEAGRKRACALAHILPLMRDERELLRLVFQTCKKGHNLKERMLPVLCELLAIPAEVIAKQADSLYAYQAHAMRGNEAALGSYESFKIAVMEAQIQQHLPPPPTKTGLLRSVTAFGGPGALSLEACAEIFKEVEGLWGEESITEMSILGSGEEVKGIAMDGSSHT